MKDIKIENGIKEIKNIVMTDVEKKRIHDNILSSSSKSIQSPWFFESFSFLIKRRNLAYYIVIPLVFIISGGGVVFASQDSLPSSILYPIKVKIVEPIEGAISFSGEAKAKHESNLAKKRLIEAETLAKNGKLTAKNENKINNLLTIHTESLNKALDKVNEEDSSDIAEEIIINFRAEMNAHAKVLEMITTKDGKRGYIAKWGFEDDDTNVSSTARISAEKIKNTSKSNKKTEEDDLKKYNEKKIKVKNLIEDVEDKDDEDTDVENFKSNRRISEDTKDTIDKAKAYLDDADKKDQEGSLEEAYSSLLDSESSVKEANILKEVEQRVGKFKNNRDKQKDD